MGSLCTQIAWQRIRIGRAVTKQVLQKACNMFLKHTTGDNRAIRYCLPTSGQENCCMNVIEELML